ARIVGPLGRRGSMVDAYPMRAAFFRRSASFTAAMSAPLSRTGGGAGVAGIALGTRRSALDHEAEPVTASHVKDTPRFGRGQVKLQRVLISSLLEERENSVEALEAFFWPQDPSAESASSENENVTLAGNRLDVARRSIAGEVHNEPSHARHHADVPRAGQYRSGLPDTTSSGGKAFIPSPMIARKSFPNSGSATSRRFAYHAWLPAASAREDARREELRAAREQKKALGLSPTPPFARFEKALKNDHSALEAIDDEQPKRRKTFKRLEGAMR
ncbi:MAG: hypothetical protein JWO82_2109, partial [Akkermansiaceae bacterium]|nr:hypothetical protein [Akkermansiaceae bacterium]